MSFGPLIIFLNSSGFYFSCFINFSSKFFQVKKNITWKKNWFISTGFQFNHLDGTGFYGGSCGGFSGGTQMAESASQPEKDQEQQQQPEMPTSRTAQQQLIQIGEH